MFLINWLQIDTQYIISLLRYHIYGSIVNQQNVERKRSIDSLDPFKNNYLTECTRSQQEKITTLMLDSHNTSRPSFATPTLLRDLRNPRIRSGLFP